MAGAGFVEGEPWSIIDIMQSYPSGAAVDVPGSQPQPGWMEWLYGKAEQVVYWPFRKARELAVGTASTAGEMAGGAVSSALMPLVPILILVMLFVLAFSSIALKKGAKLSLGR